MAGDNSQFIGRPRSTGSASGYLLYGGVAVAVATLTLVISVALVSVTGTPPRDGGVATALLVAVAEVDAVYLVWAAIYLTRWRLAVARARRPLS